MKSILLSILIGFALLTASCGKQESTPLLEQGTVVSGTLWDRPLTATNRTGNAILKGTEIRIYPAYVVLIGDDGVKQITRIECISDLKIR